MSTHFTENGICKGRSLTTILIFPSYFIFKGFASFGPQVDDFATNVMGEKSNFYGFASETLHSLMLGLLPPIGYGYKQMSLKPSHVDEHIDIKVFLLKCLLDALRENAGFQIPKVGTD